MVVQRKQFGCITLLFVHVGLALYVIVLFLAPNTDGGVKPIVLNVQKVGVAQNTNQAAIDTISSTIHTQLLESGYNPDTATDTSLSTITAAERTQIEDKIVAGVSQAISGHKLLLIGSDGTEQSATLPTSSDVRILATLQSSNISWEETTFIPLSFSIHTIGSSPRAPSVIA